MTVSPKLRVLFDEDVTPKELFQSFVREIGLYARIPEKTKTGIRYKKSGANGRLLSYREMGEIEERMIGEGSGLKPRYSKGGREMRNTREKIEERMGKLYEVIREQIGKHRYFKTKMLMDSITLRERITDSQGYLKRTMHEDLRRLAEKGLVYCRGRGATSAWYLGDGKMETGPEDTPPINEAPVSEEGKGRLKPEDVTCFGFNEVIDKISKCRGCDFWEQCRDACDEGLIKEALLKNVHREEPLIPRHVTVDVNVTFRLGYR